MHGKSPKPHANPAPLSAVNFRRSKKNDLVPNVLNDEVTIKSYCSKDPRLSELVKNKSIQLKEIVLKAVVLSSVSMFDDTQLECGTDIADDDETCVPAPLGSLFESCTINFNARKLGNYSKNVFSQYEKSY